MATRRGSGESAERSVMIALVAVILSLGFHIGGIYALSNVDFATKLRGEWKVNRFQSLPPMNVQRFEGDPMSESPDRGGESLPAPKEDADDAAKVDRLESSSDAPAAAPLEVSSDSEMLKPLEVRPTASDDVWMPRQEIADVIAPTVEDSDAALPRMVVPKVDRVKFAEDVVPAADLLAAGTSSGNLQPVALPPALLPSTGTGAGGSEDRFGFAPAVPPPIPPTEPAAVLPPPLEVSVATAETSAESAAEAVAKSQAAEVPAATEILGSVDEMVIASEKNAVEKLKDELPSKALAPEVKTGVIWWDDVQNPGRRYFRVTIEPGGNTTLPVIKKDVLFLVDASGSVYNSFRPTCDGISRMMRRLNEGDRFNIVFFRNRFTPVFSGWRDATDTSFQLADVALKREKAHGTTDVFASLTSILKMPRDPARPIIAVMASDGKPEGEGVGVTRSADIISRFSALNGGMSSVYFYGISSSANAYLIDMIAARNRGDSTIQRGMFSSIADGLVRFNAKFASPVVSDLSVTFASSSRAETYPQLVPNLCLGQRVEIYGTCPTDVREVLFSVKGLAGDTAYESVFKLGFDAMQRGTSQLREGWANKKMHEMVSRYTVNPDPVLMADMRAFSVRYGVEIPYLSALKESGK